jgi:hypothetical protein
MGQKIYFPTPARTAREPFFGEPNLSAYILGCVLISTFVVAIASDLNAAKNIGLLGLCLNQPGGPNSLYCVLSTDSSGLLKAHTIPLGQRG